MSDLCSQLSNQQFNPNYREFKVPPYHQNDYFSELPYPSLISANIIYSEQKNLASDSNNSFKSNHVHNIQQLELKPQQQLVNQLTPQPILIQKQNIQFPTIVQNDNQADLQLLYCNPKSSVSFNILSQKRMQNKSMSIKNLSQIQKVDKLINRFKQILISLILLNKQKSQFQLENWMRVKKQCFLQKYCRYLNEYLTILSNISMTIQLILLIYQNTSDIIYFVLNILNIVSILCEFQTKTHVFILTTQYITQLLLFRSKITISAIFISTSFYITLLNIILSRFKQFILMQNSKNTSFWFKIYIGLFIFLNQHIFAIQFMKYIISSNLIITYNQAIIIISFLSNNTFQQFDIFIYVILLYYAITITTFLTFILPEFQFQVQNTSSVKRQYQYISKSLTIQNSSKHIKKQIENIFQHAQLFDFDSKISCQQIKLIPPNLQQSIFVDLRLPLLQKIRFFNEQFTKQLLISISNQIQDIIISPGQNLKQISKDYLIIILEGQLLITTQNGNVITKFNKGQQYGIQYLLIDEDININLIPQCFCQILVLSKQSFQNIIKDFKKDQEKYMMLKDLDESEKLKKVHIECLICKKNHKTMNCKSFQYYPNKIKIIKIYNKNDEQKRQNYKRKLKKQQKSIQQVQILKEQLKEFFKNSSITFSQRTSEFMEQINSTVQKEKINQKQCDSQASFSEFNESAQSQQYTVTDKYTKNNGQLDDKNNSDLMNSNFFPTKSDLISIKQQCKNPNFILKLQRNSNKRLSGKDQKIIVTESNLNQELIQDNEERSLRQYIDSDLYQQDQYTYVNKNSLSPPPQIGSQNQKNMIDDEDGYSQFKYVSSKLLNENVTNKKLITESIISSNEDNVASTEFKYFHTEKEIPISFDKGKEYSFFFREGNLSNVIKDFNQKNGHLMRRQNGEHKKKFIE